MSAKRTSSAYALPIPIDDFARLTSREWKDPCGPDLGTELDKLTGVYSTEYNEHFGSFIYFHVRAENDTPETHAAIESIVQRHLHPRKHGLQGSGS